MKLYVLLEYYYEESEIVGIFSDEWTANNYMYAYIIERSRINCSDKSLQKDESYFDIEEHNLL